MDTLEMANKLLKNPKLRARKVFPDGVTWIVKNINGSIMFDGDTNPCFLDFSDCCLRHKDWELVREPVTWNEAMQAWLDGKSLCIEFDGQVYEQFKNDPLGYLRIKRDGEWRSLPGFFKGMFSDGRWYIAD